MWGWYNSDGQPWIVRFVIDEKRNHHRRAVGVVLVSAWFVVPRVRQSRREAAYRFALAPFQRDLPIGTARGEVKRYLDSRHAAQFEDWAAGEHGRPTYAVRVGEDPGTLVCGPRAVYIALEFDSANVLRDVHIRKQIGGCL
jgi:hypothetical protein